MNVKMPKFISTNQAELRHTLKGEMNFKDSSESASDSPVRATASALRPIFSRSSWRPESINGIKTTQN